MNKLSQRTWVLITLAGFIIFLAFFYFIITNQHKIELTTSTYFFLIVIIDLVATGFLFGAMKSVATLDSKALGPTFSLAGPAAMFVIFLYLGYEYRPINTSGQLLLTIFLKDAEDDAKTLIPARASLLTNRATFDGDISQLGTIRFNGIPSDLKGQSFRLNLAVPGYHLVDPDHFAFDKSQELTSLYVNLKKDKILTSFTGQLIEESTRKGIAGATINFDGTGVSTKTDNNGSFAIDLPVATGTELRVIAQLSGKEIYSSLRVISQNTYLLLAAD